MNKIQKFQKAGKFAKLVKIATTKAPSFAERTLGSVRPVVASTLLNGGVKTTDLVDKTGLTAEKIFSETEGINPYLRFGEVEFSPNLNYRQVGPGTALRFVNTGKQFAPATHSTSTKDRRLFFSGPGLDNPMYAHGFLWYGIGPGTLEAKPDLLVTGEPTLFANKYAHAISEDRGGRRIPAGILDSSNTSAYTFVPGYGFRRVGPEKTFSFTDWISGKIQLPDWKPLTLAERLGIPKRDRGNLNQEQLDALADLESYLTSGRAKRTFTFNTNTGTFEWKPKLETGDIPGMSAIIQAAGNKGVRPTIGRASYSTDNGGQGTVFYVSDKEAGAPTNAGYSSIFPRPEGWSLGWTPGVLSIRTSPTDHTGSLVMTSPRVDALDVASDILDKEKIDALPDTINPSIVKDFWITNRQVVKPGTYISGDTSDRPLGGDLLADVDDHKMGKIAYDIFSPKTSKEILRSRMGLSPDSYSSIIRQGLRDGNALRYKGGFIRWNDAAVKNRNIYDTYQKFLNGEITAEEYANITNDWIRNIGGTKFAEIRDGQVVIPHPFVYFKKQGGKLCETETL